MKNGDGVVNGNNEEEDERDENSLLYAELVEEEEEEERKGVESGKLIFALGHFWNSLSILRVFESTNTARSENRIRTVQCGILRKRKKRKKCALKEAPKFAGLESQHTGKFSLSLSLSIRPALPWFFFFFLF